MALVEAAAAADQVYSPPAGTTQNVSTVISDGGTATAVKMQGAGTVVLSATNTYSGGTTISKGTLEATNNSSIGSGALTLDGGAFKAATGSGLNIANNLLINSTGGTVNTNGTTLELSGDIGNGNGKGALNVTGNGTLVLSGTNFFTGPTNVLTGTLVAASNDAFSPANRLTINSGAAAVISDGLFAAIGPLAGGGSLVIGPTDPFTSLLLFMNGKNTTFSGAITGQGALEVDGPGTLTLTGNSSIGGQLEICDCASVTLNGGSFKAGNGAFIDGVFKMLNGGRFTSRQFLVVGGTMSVSGTGTKVVAGTTAVGGVTPAKLTIAGGATFNTANGAEIDSCGCAGVPIVTVTGVGSQWNVHGGLAIGGGSTGGPGILTIANGGRVYSADFTTIDTGSTLNLGTGGRAGSLVTPVILNNGAIVANFTDTLKLGAEIDGNGTLTKKGTGTLILSGDNSYDGNTLVSGGMLEVRGTNDSSTTVVTNGATLSGAGTIGRTTIKSGGTFEAGAPGSSGTSTHVNGNLVFKAGAHYVTQLGKSGATEAIVSGKASLNGNVLATVAAGTTLNKRYTILHSAGLNGTKFTGVTANPNFIAGLSYTGTDVVLTLTGALGASGALGANQQTVAGVINTAFNNTGSLSANFSALYNLTGSRQSQALSQLSGEASVAGQRGAFQMMNEFLTVMLDPSTDGRSGSGGAALGFAPEQQASLPSDVTAAYASAFKAPVNPAFEQRWRTWGSGFGGYSKANGDTATGTHDVTARTYGAAGGIDYRVNPDAIIGFAVAGAGGNWSLSQNLGGGHDDAFQAGIYAMTHSGPAYLSAALAFANHWMSTDRTAFAGDRLTASFNAQSYGGRVETGYRFAMLPVSVTPYAALQAQAFHTPAYSEADVTGGGFGLNLASRDATDTRSELGARFDTMMPLRDGMSLTLRARAAWAHDWVDNPALTATFQTLPGGSFTVSGASPAKDSALASLGAELRINRAWSITAKFDGEFASGVQSYAGTGTIRYVW